MKRLGRKEGRGAEGAGLEEEDEEEGTTITPTAGYDVVSMSLIFSRRG
jgi:hypothetical protein